MFLTLIIAIEVHIRPISQLHFWVASHPIYQPLLDWLSAFAHLQARSFIFSPRAITLPTALGLPSQPQFTLVPTLEFLPASTNRTSLWEPLPQATVLLVHQRDASQSSWLLGLGISRLSETSPRLPYPVDQLPFLSASGSSHLPYLEVENNST